MNQDDTRTAKNGFEKLRLRRPTRAAVIAAGAIGLLPDDVDAVTLTDGTDVTFGGVEYSNVADPETVDVPLTILPGFTGDDAYGLATDATLISGRNDAFDDFGGITVNGTSFNPPADLTDFTTTPDGGFFTPLSFADIGGIETRVDFFFDDSSPTARVFATFRNTNSATETVDVAYGGDLGCDSGCTIEDTSNGDAVFDQSTDQWTIISDGPADTDPFLTFVRFGPGGQAPADSPAYPGVVTAFDLDLMADIWELELEAGETESLLMFVHLGDSLAESQAASANFASLQSLDAAGLTVGLSSTQLTQTVNWVPEPSCISMGLCLIVAAFLARWRR